MNQLAPIEQFPAPELAPTAPTKRQKRAMSDAAAFAKFGVHPLKLKASTIQALGKELDEAGMKHLGNGRVVVASEHADTFIDRFGKMIDKMACKEDPDYDKIIEMGRLIREFNQQLLASGEIHLRVAKAGLPVDPSGASVAFPAGTPLMIAVGSTPKPTT